MRIVEGPHCRGQTSVIGRAYGAVVFPGEPRSMINFRGRIQS